MQDSGAWRPELIYKKTDSTLRGNIAAELRALADLFPTWRIGYAPAYPALGRTVKNGVLYVDDVPVSETAVRRITWLAAMTVKSSESEPARAA